jgi:predicted RNA methylase
MASITAEDSRQLLFDFSFTDITGHVSSAVIPRLLEEEKKLPAAAAAIPAGAVSGEDAPLNEKAAAEPFGAWLSFDRRLTISDRERYNSLAEEIIKKPADAITNKDRAVLRNYSGFGGTGREGERGVLYDYYTSPPVASMMWTLLNNIKPIKKGDRVLEPSCGTGVFFATAPSGVTLAGVEIDPRTAAVARLLHPAARIRNMSFEAFNISRDPSDNFDYVIGNAPFGDRGTDTAFLDLPEEKSLDRYFISRGVDALKPGGVMAIIAHPGIIDNQSNRQFRAAAARKAVFLGAIRLNDHAFAHTHTQIQADILFFQKHPGGLERHTALIPDDLLQAELHSGFINPVFPYYESFPLHVMGDVSRGTGQWGSDTVKGRVTPESVAGMISVFKAGTTADELLAEGTYEAVRQKYPLPEETPPPPKTLRLAGDETRLVSSKLIRPGFLKTEGNAVYILSDDFRWSLASDRPGTAARVKRIAHISAAVREIRDAMRRSQDVKQRQSQTSEAVEDYKALFGAYPKNDPRLWSFIRKNPAVSGVYDGLIDPLTPVLNSASLYNAANTVDGHSPAVSALYTLREHSRPATADAVAKWFPDEGESLIREMDSHPDIFLTPQNEYQLREDFISGDAWGKIDELENAKKAFPGGGQAADRFTRYQIELRKATNWTPFEESNVTPHAPWIPEEIVNGFIHDGICPRHYALTNVTLTKNERGKWGAITVNDKGENVWNDYADPAVYYLNRQEQRSRYYDTETFNKEYNELFLSYASNHGEYRDTIETAYNRLYNTEIKAPVKTYPVLIDEWTGAKTLKGHQLQSVHHLLRQQKGISALGTGFGKTLAGIALYSVLRQEGKLHRAFFQVPNNKVKDWVQEIADVMPSLKTGYIDPEMPGYSSINKRYAAYHRLANSAYDILIFPESAASEIQLSPENDSYITENIIARHIAEKKPRTARQAEELKEKVKESLQNGKTNKSITFEDLGCDAIFVDEAHRYKNLFTSSLSREIGLNDGRQSAKAMALFKKTALIRRQNQDKNVFLFTATPLTNSPLEYYNMLMYIAPEELEKFNILTINNFIRGFADIRQSEIYDWKTGEVTTKKILVGFYNIRTLQDIFFKYTDYQNDPKAINLEKPDPVLSPHIIPKDALQADAVKEISKDLEIFSKLDSDEKEELFPHQNYLTFYTRLRTASLDLELYDPGAFRGWHNPKLYECAREAWKTFQTTGAGQLILCDRVFSSDNSFNMHDKIASYLVKEGFEESRIAAINGFTKSGALLSDEKTQKLTSEIVSNFNRGRYKIIIGTTACIGEGLNLQENSAAIHHLDIPFRPSDFIQRNGRIDRQGNSQDKVHINSYMSRGTIDNYSVNLVQNKANWIDELLKSKTSVFVNKDDESSINPGELLLALSEEWGDEGKTASLREKIKHDAEEALRKEKEAKIKSLITSLAKLRAPLYAYNGDKSSFTYRQRVERINNIEKTLLANPSFTHKEIIGGKKPFIYSAGRDEVIMPGDYFFHYSEHTTVVSVDPKKLSFTIRELNNKNGKNREIPLSSFNPEKYTFVHAPGKTLMDAIPVLDKNAFYSIGDQKIKELFYRYHIEHYGDKEPVPVIQEGNNNITIDFTDEITYSKRAYALNPFSADGIEKIKSAKTVSFSPDNDGRANALILDKIKEYADEAYNVIAEKLSAVPPLYSHIAGGKQEYTPKGVRSLIQKLRVYPYYKNDPLLAARAVLENTPDNKKEVLKESLKKSGCINGESTKNIISIWSADKNSGNISSDGKKFLEDHVHVVGIDI